MFFIVLSCTIKNTKFLNCKINDCDFFYTNLTNSSFEHSDLLGTKFEHSNLSCVSFLNAQNYNINPNKNILKKTKFSFPEVVSLLGAYDIEIE
ncbi:MAG: hypothetical protein CVT90_02520 [Candidatus Altiarchaeales archaeon HGW-Altiarchaeales-3]|nr:MAG: hypothetical protein CVT90_02520 [Candidatus Altiarchaeales archaeon HGW-Altiarchaeales-3]